MTERAAHPIRKLLRSLAALYPLAALARAAAPATDEGAVTTMEPVFVEASTHAPWRHIAVPGYEIISRCPDDFNRAYVRALREATAARLALLPGSFWGEMATPMKIVLYDRAPAKREGILPENPVDLSWSPENGAVVGSETVQLSHPATVGDGDTFISCGNYWNLDSAVSDLSVDPDSKTLLENRVPRLPAWFVAGVVGPRGIYVDRLIKGTPAGSEVVLANALWTTLAETIAIQDENREKKKQGAERHVHGLMPLGDLFSGRIPRGERDLWNAEAALLVRWELFGGGDRKAFLAFVEQATREPVTEGLFRKFLGLDYAEAEQRLRGYLPGAVTERIRLKIGAISSSEEEARDATSADVARIIGDWGRLEGKAAGIQYLEYRSECMDQAAKLFEGVSNGRSSNPLFLAAYGLYQLQAGDELRGQRALEAAAKAGVVRPRVYVELARMRLDGALPFVRKGVGDLGESDFNDILALLTKAREQMPALLPCYHVLVEAYEHAPTKPPRADLGVLDEALRLFPRDAALACRMATLYSSFGYIDEASAIVERALRFAETDEDRALLSRWHPGTAGG